MSLAYCCERSYRSIIVLCTDPGNLRERLPHAWDVGQSTIAISEVSEFSKNAANSLEELRKFFSQKKSSMFGDAHASVRRKHDTTLVRLPEKMVEIDAQLNAVFDAKIEEVRK